MASIRKWRGKHQVRWRTPDGRLRSRAFPKMRDARSFKAQIEVDLARGEWLDPRDSQVLVADYVQQWLATKIDVAPRTYVNIEGLVRNHLVPGLGDRLLASVKPIDIEGWIASLTAKELSPSSVRKCFEVAAQVFAKAERDRLVRRSPCIGIDLPSDRRREEMRFLSVEEVASLAEAIDPRYRALILTAAYSGLRAGEIEALQVQRVDLLRGRLEVVESVAEVHGRLVTVPPKTRASRRAVRVPRFVAESIADHLARFPGETAHIFTSAEGQPIRHNNLMRRHFKPALERAGLESAIRFHDLRHTCAAILTANGWSMEQVKRHLGHSSIRVTSDRYGHLFEGHDDALLDDLDRRFRDVRPAERPERGLVIEIAKAGRRESTGA